MCTVILGVDPGFANFGWAAIRLSPERIEAAGVLRTAKSHERRRILAVDDNVRRTRELVVSLRGVLGRFDVAAICAESMSHVRNASASAKVSLAWGVVITLAEQLCIPLLQASPQEVKFRVTGAKSASKDEVAFSVRKQIGDLDPRLDDVPDGLHEHAYDAAAVALACMSSDVVRALRRAA